MSQSTEPGEPRNHHFVPQAFLRNWCANGTELTRILVRHGKTLVRRLGTSAVGSREFLYKIDPETCGSTVHIILLMFARKFGLNGIQFNFEDSLMQRIDQLGSKAHRRFLEEKDAAADMQCLFDLLRYLYVLRARNPFYLERINEPSVQRLEALCARHGAQDNAFLDLAGLRANLHAAKLDVIEAVLNLDTIRQRYDGMACILCDIDPETNRYVTGDLPYVELPLADANQRVSALHVAPLSPARCLVMSKSMELIDNIKRNTNEHFVDLVNAVIMMASGEVYAWDDSVRDQAGEYLGLMWSNPAAAHDILLQKMQKSVGRP